MNSIQRKALRAELKSELCAVWGAFRSACWGSDSVSLDCARWNLNRALDLQNQIPKLDEEDGAGAGDSR